MSNDLSPQSLLEAPPDRELDGRSSAPAPSPLADGYARARAERRIRKGKGHLTLAADGEMVSEALEVADSKEQPGTGLVERDSE